MKLEDIVVFKRERFSIEQEVSSGKYYLSLPVSNGLIEYEEQYEITDDEYARFCKGLEEIKALAQACRQRKEDQRLLVEPGKLRGSPV